MTTVANRDLGKLNYLNSPASPTPATDGRYIVAHFGEAGTYGLDFSGKRVWQHREPEASVEYGTASSPVFWRDLAVITYDTDEVAYTVALAKESGEVRWRTERSRRILAGSAKLDAYSTPLLFEHGAKPQLITNSSQLVVGYDPESGEEIWRIPVPDKQPIVSPVAWKDLIVVVGGPPHGPRFMGAFRLPGEGPAARPEVAWELERNRPEISSPVIYDGLLYMVTESGIASCVDLESGEVRWKTRLPASRYHPSVTAAAGKVYFSNADGRTIVAAAGPELRLLSQNQLDGSLRASMAISDGRIFLRTGDHLYSISGAER